MREGFERYPKTSKSPTFKTSEKGFKGFIYVLQRQNCSLILLQFDYNIYYELFGSVFLKLIESYLLKAFFNYTRE